VRGSVSRKFQKKEIGDPVRLQNILAALDRGRQLVPRPRRPFAASASDWPVATETVFGRVLGDSAH